VLSFGVLMYVSRRYEDRLLDGDVFTLYVVLYPLGRFFVESLRPDAWKVASIPVAQIIALVCIAVAGATLWYRHRIAPVVPGPSAPEAQ
jgi:phosphatidylglycerol:prolipoprotein diacylglycerol transferase